MADVSEKDECSPATMARSSYQDVHSLAGKLKTKPNSLSVLSLNVQGFNSKYNLLLATLEELRLAGTPISIVALQECYFANNKKYIDNDVVDLSGYVFPCYNVVPPQPSKLGRTGGLTFLIHEDFQYKKRDPLCIQEDNWEALFIDVTADFMKKPVTIGNIYRPGRNDQQKIQKFRTQLNQIIKKMGTPGKYQLLVGDINFNLLNIDASPMITDYFTNLAEQGFTNHITLPTRKCDTTVTLLDHIWLRSPPTTCTSVSQIQSYILTDKISDHMACVCTFDILNPKFEMPKFVCKRDMSDLNLHRFATDFQRSNLTETIGPDLDKDPNTTYEIFHNTVKSIRDRHVPIQRKKFNRKKHQLHPWLTKGILRSINTKNKLYVQMNKLPRDSLQRQAKKDKFKEFENILNKTIRLQKKLFYHNQFQQYTNDIRNTWKTIKTILNKNKKSSSYPSTFVHNGQDITNPKEIANGLNSFFTNIGPDLAKEINTDGKPDVMSYMGQKRNKRLFFNFTTAEKIRKIIMSLKTKSSSGEDGISSAFLKNEHILSAICPSLTILVNQSLCTGIFPERLKVAKVIPLFKDKGDDFSFEYYRPISLLSTISKVYERVVFDQLYEYFDGNKLFYSSQYGFRKKHSTETAGLELIDRAMKDNDKKQDPFAIFLDLSKAFDTIDHVILIKKLSHYGITGTALLWFESYLTNRMQYVIFEETMSNVMKITTGVPQGSILGPLLFLIYINDIKNAATLFELIGYADDTTLYGTLKKFAAATPRGGSVIQTVNQEIDRICSWLSVNKLSLNASKTRMMFFKYHQRTQLAVNKRYLPAEGPQHYLINNTKIKVVQHFNFLGIELHMNLNWTAHIDKIAKKIGKGYGIITKLKYFLPQKVLVMLYNTLIQSHINYGILLWGFAPEKIATLQKKAIRAITLSKYHAHTPMLFKQLGILNLDDIVTMRCLKFYYNFQNGHVPQYFTTDFTYNDVTQKPRTEGASQCLRIHLYKNVLANCPPNVLDKVFTHSFDGFSNYVKTFLLTKYTACPIGPNNCFPCRESTRRQNRHVRPSE